MTRFLMTACLAICLVLPGFSQTKEVVKEIETKLDSLRKDDDTLKSVLATHPSIAAARAKVQLAMAELQQAELAIAQQLQTLKAEQEMARAQLTAAKMALELTKTAGDSHDAKVTQTQARTKVDQTELALSRLETAYDALVKPSKNELLGHNPLSIKSNQSLGDYVVRPAIMTVAENTTLAAVVNKVIAMDTKGMVADAINELKTKSGYLGIIRMPTLANGLLNDRVLKFNEKAEVPFSTWFEIILDEFNSKMDAKDVHDVFIREYGLLVIERSKAPAGAMTLREFAKQAREMEKVKK